MTKESSHFLILAFLSFLVIVFLGRAVVGFTVPVEELTQTCTNAAVSTLPFIAQTLHAWVYLLSGAALTLCVVAGVVIFFRTRKKVNSLHVRCASFPHKLSHAMCRAGLRQSEVLYAQTPEQLVFCFGFFRPKILISRGVCIALQRKELEAVLLHEKYHLRHSHVIKLFLSKVISASFFFLPVFRVIAKHMEYAFERSADAYAMSVQGESTFLKSALATFLGSREVAFRPGFSSIFTERRIYDLVSHVPSVAKETWGRTILSITISIIVFLSIIFPASVSANQVVSNTSQQMITVCMSWNACVVTCTQNHAQMSIPASIKNGQ